MQRLETIECHPIKYQMGKVLSCWFILLFAAGCSKNNNNNNNANENATDIFPNKIGDTWVYLVNDTAVHINTMQSKTVTQYNMTVSIVDSVLLPASIHDIQLPPGEEAHVWVFNYSGVTDTNYVYQTGDTVIFFDVNQTSKAFARQYIIPFRLHNSWLYTVEGLGEVTVDSQVDVTIGQNHFYNTFYIDGSAGMPDEEFNVSEWMANNVGIVQRYVQTGGTNVVDHFTKWSLISYHLK
jgi:hypothetical protein